MVNSLADREISVIRANFAERGQTVRRERAEDGDTVETRRLPKGSRTVRGYELQECLGAGAFGRVHLARKVDTSEEFAIKEVPLAPIPDRAWSVLQDRQNRRLACRASTPRNSRKLLEVQTIPDSGIELAPCQVAKEISEEVRLLRLCDHPNIVKYFASFTTGCDVTSTLWIVMELCRGITLQSFMQSMREKSFPRLPEDQTWQIFVQVCLALRYLHSEKGIAHRDLTPNNILVQPQTLEAKLTDFGLARQKVSTATHAASMMKSMVGTILYSCPEIVQSSNYSNKADVWSLGCVLYKMATLRDPFQGNNPLVVARNIVECTYSRLEVSPYVSELLVSTCERCLTVSPEERPGIEHVCQLITPVLLRQLEILPRGNVSTEQHQARIAPAVVTPAAIVATTGADFLQPLLEDVAAKLPQHADFSSDSNASGDEPPVHLQETSRSRHNRQHVKGSARPVAELPCALLLMHRLAFIAQLSDGQGIAGDREPERQAVDHYQRWFFGRARAHLVRREVSRLVQRSSTLVGNQSLGAPLSWSYCLLHQHILDICAENGYDALESFSSESSGVDDEGAPDSVTVGVCKDHACEQPSVLSSP